MPTPEDSPAALSPAEHRNARTVPPALAPMPDIPCPVCEDEDPIGAVELPGAILAITTAYGDCDCPFHVYGDDSRQLDFTALPDDIAERVYLTFKSARPELWLEWQGWTGDEGGSSLGPSTWWHLESGRFCVLDGGVIRPASVYGRPYAWRACFVADGEEHDLPIDGGLAFSAGLNRQLCPCSI